MSFYSETEVNHIVENVVEACKKPDSLSMVSHEFLTRCLGIDGGTVGISDKKTFIERYSNNKNLKNVILEFQKHNQGGSLPANGLYGRFRQKRKMYNTICNKIQKLDS